MEEKLFRNDKGNVECCSCHNEAIYVDSMNNVVCEDCMSDDLDGLYSGQTFDDYKLFEDKEQNENKM